jgi:hypothetical protein
MPFIMLGAAAMPNVAKSGSGIILLFKQIYLFY